MADAWKKWQDIGNAKNDERGYYGIYQIRIVDEISEKPTSIPRIGGVDKKGVIYIGKAEPNNSLGSRIDSFFERRHSGSGTYDLMWEALRLKQHPCWKHHLQYRVIRLFPDKVEPDLDDVNEFLYKKRIREEEIKALAEYFSKYAELPPCNSTIPEKWKRFLGVLIEFHGFKWDR